MKKEEFEITKEGLQPYNFERYKEFNPNLTEPVYKHLRLNHSEWKILCGLSVSTHWGDEILKKMWYLKMDELYKDSIFYKNRHEPENYLALDTW